MISTARHRRLERNNEPYFYKYASVDTARKILISGNLRWSKPIVFNDPFEFQFVQTPDFEDDAVLQETTGILGKVLGEGLPVAHDNALGRVINQARAAPGFKTDEFIDSYISGLNLGGLKNESQSVAKIRANLEDAKILCLTIDPANVLMWSHYAGAHTGVALKFVNRSWADSVFSAAQPVIYSDCFPSLYDRTEIPQLLAGQFSLGVELILNTIIFTKASTWKYEKEWRIINHREDSSIDFRDHQFAPIELDSVIFGLRATQENFHNLANLARNQNPQVRLAKLEMCKRSYDLQIVPVTEKQLT